MSRLFMPLYALLALLVFALLGGAFFTVRQTEQALILRFGEPVPERGLVSAPGLHVKLPFVENVVYIDKRILDVESSKQEVLASDNQRLEVDAFMRYRIVNPLLFYQSVGTVEGANIQLVGVMNSSLRRVLGEANLPAIVRDNRAGLMEKIKAQVAEGAARFGLDIVDVRIRRVDLPLEISEKVYNRMQTERQREAAEYRAQGSQQAQEIRAKADRDVTVIKGEAQKEADQISGAGEAERNRIFAEAFGKDPGFFAFYRAMQAYQTALKGQNTRFVFSEQSDFFRFLPSPMGRAPNHSIEPNPSAGQAFVPSGQ